MNVTITLNNVVNVVITLDFVANTFTQPIHNVDTTFITFDIDVDTTSRPTLYAGWVCYMYNSQV